MKSFTVLFSFALAMVFALALTATAGDFVPRAIAQYTKAHAGGGVQTFTIPTTGIREIKVQCDVATAAQFNGTGSTYPVAINTDATFKIAPNVRSVVFQMASSNAAKYCYAQRH
jgi:hypothetical protein